MNGLKALIFDVDGTLAETEAVHLAAFNGAFAEWGLDWHWDEPLYRQLLKTTGGKERMMVYQTRFAPDGRQMTADDIARLHVDKTAIYAQMMANGDLKLRPGIAELIAMARADGLKLAVATTTNLPNVEALCQCCWGQTATEIFDVIAAGDQVAAKKPAPDVYLLALRRLGLPAAACVAFEDSLNGLLSAKAAGLRVIATASAYNNDDLSGADISVENVAEIDWAMAAV